MSFLTSGTHSVGRFATFTVGIFGNMIELVRFACWLCIGLCATGGTSGSASCVEFPLIQSQVVLQTEPSVKGCNLSGKEFPPKFAGVDWCLVTATTGTCMVLGSRFICDSVCCLRWLLSCFPRVWSNVTSSLIR